MPPGGGGIFAAAPRDTYASQEAARSAPGGALLAERVSEAGQGFSYPGQYFVMLSKCCCVTVRRA